MQYSMRAENCLHQMENYLIRENMQAVSNSILTHCGRVTQICVFNTVKLGTYASSP